MFFNYNPIYNMKEVYLNKISDKDSMILKTNIKYYKNPKNTSTDLFMIEKRLNQFEEILKDYKQLKKNNREGYEVILKIPNALKSKDKRNELKRYIDKLMKKITSSNKDIKLIYLSFIRKNKYLNIIFYDRVIYTEPKIVKYKKKARKNIYVNKKGFVIDKNKKGAKLIAKKGNYYYEKKIINAEKYKKRIEWIHSRRGKDNSLFEVLIKQIKIIIDNLLNISDNIFQKKRTN